MSLLPSRPDRRLLPRWRIVLAGTALPDMASLRVGTTQNLNGATLDGIETATADWRKERTLFNALDMLTSASVLPENEEIRRAALFVEEHKNSSDTAKRLARAILDGTSVSENVPTNAQAAIGRWRQALRRDPRNAIAALNLAHVYTGLQLDSQAKYYLDYAFRLAPNNRLVVRAYSRFLLHERKLDEAHAFILKANTLLTDPWLLSSEMAIAELRARPTRHIKHAKSFANNENLRPLHLSELRAQFGELEAAHGNTKLAKRMLTSSMIEPTENVLAQTQFVVAYHHLAGIDLNAPISRVPDAYEAMAYRAFESGLWKEALNAALKWESLEPFSSRPTWLAFEIANLGLQDDVEAVKYAKRTAEKARHDPIAINNLAYAYALAWQIPEAVSTLQEVMRVIREGEIDVDSAVLHATYGLILFRTGNIDEGRHQYQIAINFFESRNDDRLIVAIANFAREEHLNGDAAQAQKMIARASAMVKPFSSSHVKYSVAGAKKAITTLPAGGGKRFHHTLAAH